MYTVEYFDKKDNYFLKDDENILYQSSENCLQLFQVSRRFLC